MQEYKKGESVLWYKMQKTEHHHSFHPNPAKQNPFSWHPTILILIHLHQQENSIFNHCFLILYATSKQQLYNIIQLSVLTESCAPVLNGLSSSWRKRDQGGEIASKFTYDRRKRNPGDWHGVSLANYQLLARENLIVEAGVQHWESKVKLYIYTRQGQKLAVKSVECRHSQMDISQLEDAWLHLLHMCNWVSWRPEIKIIYYNNH